MQARILVLLITLLTACATSGAGPGSYQMPVQELFGGIYCGLPSQGPIARWISKPEQLPPLLDQVRRRASGPPRGAAPVWDPAAEIGLWIQMGEKPTGGYGLHLDDAFASVRDGVATLRIQWRQPPPDAFVPQVITSPCLLVKLPRSGYNAIRIQDQDGNVRMRINAMTAK